MSIEKFDDECPGCRPVLINTETGQVLSEEHPQMQVVNKLWQETTKAEREAYHRVCCQNSRANADQHLAGGFAQRIKIALEALKIEE